MQNGDHEHIKFEEYAISKDMERSQHPLHLLYLDRDTDNALSAFKAGYLAAKNRADDLGNTLENGLNVICESLGISTEHYDTDQADTECYLDCFKDAAAALKKFGIKFDADTGEFIQAKT